MVGVGRGERKADKNQAGAWPPPTIAVSRGPAPNAEFYPGVENLFGAPSLSPSEHNCLEKATGHIDGGNVRRGSQAKVGLRNLLTLEISHFRRRRRKENGAPGYQDMGQRH